MIFASIILLASCKQSSAPTITGAERIVVTSTFTATIDTTDTDTPTETETATDTMTPDETATVEAFMTMMAIVEAANAAETMIAIDITGYDIIRFYKSLVKVSGTGNTEITLKIVDSTGNFAVMDITSDMSATAESLSYDLSTFTPNGDTLSNIYSDVSSITWTIGFLAPGSDTGVFNLYLDSVDFLKP